MQDPRNTSTKHGARYFVRQRLLKLFLQILYIHNDNSNRAFGRPAVFDCLGAVFDRLGAVFDRFAAVFDRFCAVFDCLGAVIDRKTVPKRSI